MGRWEFESHEEMSREEVAAEKRAAQETYISEMSKIENPSYSDHHIAWWWAYVYHAHTPVGFAFRREYDRQRAAGYVTPGYAQ